MFDEKQFKAALLLSGVSLDDVAKAMNINKATLYRKMNGKSDFYRDEIQAFCNLVNPEDMNKIFFAQNCVNETKVG